MLAEHPQTHNPMSFCPLNDTQPTILFLTDSCTFQILPARPPLETSIEYAVMMYAPRTWPSQTPERPVYPRLEAHSGPATSTWPMPACTLRFYLSVRLSLRARRACARRGRVKTICRRIRSLGCFRAPYASDPCSQPVQCALERKPVMSKTFEPAPRPATEPAPRHAKDAIQDIDLIQTYTQARTVARHYNTSLDHINLTLEADMKALSLPLCRSDFRRYSHRVLISREICSPLLVCTAASTLQTSPFDLVDPILPAGRCHPSKPSSKISLVLSSCPQLVRARPPPSASSATHDLADAYRSGHCVSLSTSLFLSLPHALSRELAHGSSASLVRDHYRRGTHRRCCRRLGRLTRGLYSTTRFEAPSRTLLYM
ncbi:hypothetical protein C8Q70DRAFT_531455 [Cubamyces menziesii]|nr:hypothetical protein C8Q70DRAFT_531455 [Cubamyces menziesii]